MAVIPVEKKGTIPGWGWALIALGIVGAIVLLSLFFGARREDQRTTTAGGSEVAPAAGGATAPSGQEAIMDVNALLGAADLAQLRGRQVALSDVTAGRVLSDRVFTIAAGGRELFAVLDRDLDAGAAEQRVKILAGMHLSQLSGEVQAGPAAQGGMDVLRGYGLGEGDQAALRQQQGLLLVRRVRGETGSGQAPSTGSGQAPAK